MTLQSLATILAIAAVSAAPAASAKTPSGAALAAALSRGGYVIVMRHAHAPAAPPDAAQADPANGKRERQLDPAGRASARAMGEAIRTMHLPIGTVWSSPTFRALETARLAGLHPMRIAPELGDGGHSMQAANDAQAAWLRVHANKKPRPGTDTVIVTQYPNISAAFGEAATAMADGEALVFRPTVGSSPELVGRIAIGQWPVLASQNKHEERRHGS
jgi:hypothetical protein